MAQKPVWSESEFEILLNSYGLPDEELDRRLPRRSRGAISAVRAFTHNYHLEGERDLTGLSQPMRRRLEEGRGSLTCPKCGEQF